MTLRISALLLLPALVIGPALRAQPVFHDSQAPQVSFASAQIARALGPKRATADHGLRDLNSFAGSLRFAIAGDAAESNALAQTLHVAPLNTTAPQAYVIRRAEQRGRVTIAVLGADANGAMYGGLDVAEAIHRLDRQDRRFRPLAAHRAARNQIQHCARSPNPHLFR